MIQRFLGKYVAIDCGAAASTTCVRWQKRDGGESSEPYRSMGDKPHSGGSHTACPKRSCWVLHSQPFNTWG
jgi:hypothetical protein